MKVKLHVIGAGLLLVALASFLQYVPVSAQLGNISVTPTVSELKLIPGVRKTIAYDVMNTGDSVALVTVEYFDFDPIGTQGQPDLLDGNTASEYGLKDWFEPTATFSLASQESKSVSIALTPPSTIEDKSYRGAVVFKMSQTIEGVKTSQSIGALVLADIGELVPDADFPVLSVDDIEVSESGLDANFSVKVKNTGDYAFKPEIKIDIFDTRNNVVATVSATDPGNVLPASTRVYALPFSSLVSVPDGLKARATVTLPNRSKTIIESNEVEVTAVGSTTAEEVEDLKQDADSIVTTVRLVGVIFFVLVVATTAVILLTVRKRSRREAAVSAQVVTTPYSAPTPNQISTVSTNATPAQPAENDISQQPPL